MTAAAEVSEDRLLGGRVRLRQPKGGYRVAIDPVLLAASIRARPGERLADLGCGVGAAALCLLVRLPGIEVVGLEIQDELAALARANASANGLGEAFRVFAGDVRDPPPALAAGSFDQVLCNPPYHRAAAGRPPSSPGRALASQETGTRLEDWIESSLRLLRHKGRLTFIHRADRLDELYAALAGRAGGIDLLPLWPDRKRPAKRVIVTARKGVAAPGRLLQGLVLHGPDGAFTAEATAILRQAAPLAIAEEQPSGGS